MRNNRGFTAIQTVRGNFSLRANSPLCRPCCLYGTSSVFQLYMWARRYSPTADNPGARLQKNNPALSELQRGFTLIEILISTAILLIAVAGFLAWTANVVNQRAGLSKRNVAYNIAVDVSDRLAKLSGTNVLLLPKTGNDKYLGLDSSSGASNSGDILTCNAGALSNPLISDATGLTAYTNPWSGTNLFLYDDNQGTFSTSVPLTTTANANIDHPNSTSPSYVSLINIIINPIRRAANGVTYYVVWTAAYMPCASAPTDLVKIFITVYWIEPEPSPLTVTAVNSGIQSGSFKVKNVSITLDKSLTAEQ